MSLSRCCDRSPTGLELKDILSLGCSSALINPSLDFWRKLPVDVKVEIFRRLPELDLIVSKYVCKDWNFVISRVCIPWLSPPHTSAPLLGLLTFEGPPPDEDAGAHPICDEFSKPRFIAIDRYLLSKYGWRSVGGPPTMSDKIVALLPSRDHYAAHVQDYCNGLLLMAFNSRYYVGNPTTRERLAVPVNPNSYHSKNIYSSLVFDPSLSLDFKIVSFTRPAEDASTTNPVGMDIFSSVTGEWSSRVLQLEPYNLYGSELIRPSIYYGGVLYYLSKVQYLVCIDNDILSGSCKNGCSISKAAIELPDKEQDPGHFGCIGNSLGGIYYSNRDAEGSSLLVWILVRKGKDSGWVLLHSVSITHHILSCHLFRNVNPKKFVSLRPCAFHPNDEEIFMATPYILISYHLKTKKVNEHHIPWPQDGKILLDQNWMFPFFRCLFLLKSIAKPRKWRLRKLRE